MSRVTTLGPLTTNGTSQEMYLGGNVLGLLQVVITGTITVQVEVSNGGSYWQAISSGTDVTTSTLIPVSNAFEKIRIRVSAVAGGSVTAYHCPAVL